MIITNYRQEKEWSPKPSIQHEQTARRNNVGTMKESFLTESPIFASEEFRPLNRPPEEAMIDQALVRAITVGSQVALDKLYRRYRLLLRKIVAQFLPNEADVDEVIQDVFLGIWNNAAKFDPEKGAVLGWVICIARRRAVDHIRRNRRFTAHTVRLDTIRRGAWGDHDPRENLATHYDQPASHDLLDHLRRIMAVLPPEQREVVQLTYFKSMSQREIAARTGIPLGTIKTRLELARRKLLLQATHLRQDI